MYGLSLRVAVISLGRLGYHQAARQVLCQTSDLVREPGNVLLADVSQQQVDQVVACSWSWCPEQEQAIPQQYRVSFR